MPARESTCKHSSSSGIISRQALAAHAIASSACADRGVRSLKELGVELEPGVRADIEPEPGVRRCP